MNRPAFSFCLCPDAKLLQSRIEALLESHPPAQGGAAWQRFVFWGDDGLLPSFWEHLTLQGLFAVPKALIVRNAQALAAENLRTLFTALEALAPAALRGKSGSSPGNSLVWPLICLEVNFEKGKPKVPAHIQKLGAYQIAEKAGWLDCSPGLTPQSLTAYIKAEAAKLRLNLRRDELELLASSLPADAALVSAELAKLSLLANAEGHLPDGAAGLVEHSEELSIFELLRIVQQQGPPLSAWRRILEDRLSGENLVFAFNAVLLREARILWQCLCGQEPYLPPGLAAQKNAAARALGFAGLARLWELALMADKGIKSGERSPDQAFEMLAADLFLLFGKAGRRP